MKNIAILLAGGTGKRFGEGLPKQFRLLADGRTVLQTCVDTFRACPSIDKVLVVMHSDWMHNAQCTMHDVLFIPGGKERWESSWNAIQYLSTPDSRLSTPDSRPEQGEQMNVLIHDVARPFVSQTILENVCRALQTHEAVTVAIPATDTMYQCTVHDAQCTIKDIPPRATMFRAQTPQAFRLEIIKKAYELALQSSPYRGELERGFTDDCGVVHQYLPEIPIWVVEGEEANRKITFQEDIPHQ